MKIKRLLAWIIIIILLVGGGFLLYKVFASKSENKSSEKNENIKLTDKQIEEYLLEKRLDLKEYFVFNLQREVKIGKHNIGSKKQPFYANNGRGLTPSLSTHLTQLVGEKKNWIAFQGKYANENSDEWNEDKLDQKISNGEEWWIIFDKTQVNKASCNHFTNRVALRNISFTDGCALAVEDKDNVWIAKNKQEAIEKIKTDPFFEGKI